MTIKNAGTSSFSLIGDPSIDASEWGTFKDSLKAPIHSWFTYPAGFSYKAVQHSIKQANLKIGKDTIYDPFMGSGTTNIVAKTIGLNSVGVEAHPFVYSITKSKFDWGIELPQLQTALEQINNNISSAKYPKDIIAHLSAIFPELILKCFLPETLFELLIIRESINNASENPSIQNFLRTTLICVLRNVSIAATGWPYIAPNKIKVTSHSKKGWETYQKLALKMYNDIQLATKSASRLETNHNLYLGDSRITGNLIESNSIDHIFTSPPYLNNFDYADRTRLEMYFMDEAKNWGDISSKIRSRLMTSATTQISRTDKKYNFLDSFKNDCEESYIFLNDAVKKLSDLRLVKGGKKSYDLMTVGYFNDMYQILKENYRVLKKGKQAQYILGDSAPYGVHIPTDELIGKIGVSVGFKNYEIINLRTRGGKWASNPQRHNVMLKESVVILHK